MHCSTFSCMFTTFLVGILLALFDSGLANSRQLDPAVFKRLSFLQLPDVAAANAFNIDFTYSTSENQLIDAVSYNATYNPNIDAQTVNLSIPLSEVNLKGAFYSTLNIGFDGKVLSSQNSSGTYNLQLRDVHLYFLVKFDFTLQGVELYLNVCQPEFKDHELKLHHTPINSDLITQGLMQRLTMLAAKEEYKQMFCKALRKVIRPRAEDQPSAAIQAAIIQRIQESFYPKSG